MNGGVMLLQASGSPPGTTVNSDEGGTDCDRSETAESYWTSHTTKEGRIYYCNHVTKVAGWLPPPEQWPHNDNNGLPYGWEQAVDTNQKTYYINHINKTTTYEAPIHETWTEEDVPKPRSVRLTRSPTLGFGFVAGSEKPVIVRFVTEDGPSLDKLLPGDEILSVNGVDVKEAPREQVISMVRASEQHVDLIVCQPKQYHNETIGRKSTLLSASKKARLKQRPSRVRFAESVCVNDGAPLFPLCGLGDQKMCLSNVLKVFLENGQTKSFKYDMNTLVSDVVTSLAQKLCLSATQHFSLVVEHIKSLKRNKLTILNPQDTLQRIASRPGAHKLRCLFRVSFVPISVSQLAQRDPTALDYLFSQCCNDVIAERFAPELSPEVSLRLAALHMYQHATIHNMSVAKLTIKTVEREFGLDRFIPPSLLEQMKKKEIRRLLYHFLRSYSTLGGVEGREKPLSTLQAKLLYLDIVSQLPSYGAKCFSTGPPKITTPTDCLDRVLLISPRFGLSQIGGNNVPIPIARLEDLKSIIVTPCEDSCEVAISLISDRTLHIYLETQDAVELSLVLQGYFKVLTNTILPVTLPPHSPSPPVYLSPHKVIPCKWSYRNHESLDLQAVTFSSPTFVSFPEDENMNNEVSRHEAKNEEVIRRVNELINLSEEYLREESKNYRSSFGLHPNTPEDLPDLIDLTLLPPPQTPDELDEYSELACPPTEFGDNVDQWIASVVVPPPLTPAVELTPEEIMAYIIPPPPSTNTSISSSSSSVDSLSLKRRNSEKGSFLCCGRIRENHDLVELPNSTPPPERPPKPIQSRQRSNSYTSTSSNLLPPKLPPKPPLPPVPSIEHRLPAPIHPRTAGIGSPHLQRNRNIENEIETPPTLLVCRKAVSTPTSPHLGRNSKLSAVTVPEILNGGGEHKRSNSSASDSWNSSSFSPKLRETLLSKSDVALAGLLVRLDQIAALCNAAQIHGGGKEMCEERFQIARDELTCQSLQLVQSSKCCVVSLASIHDVALPEHLASCLTILRRLTELCQDLSAHTTAPLQTRNLILKVHSVTLSFRSLINAVNISPLTQLEEKLAHHAESLANVLATLLRSLRVFSP